MFSGAWPKITTAHLILISQENMSSFPCLPTTICERREGLLLVCVVVALAVDGATAVFHVHGWRRRQDELLMGASQVPGADDRAGPHPPQTK